jgi:hypothetical protein
MAKEAQYKLFEALKAHIAKLEAERDRDRASGHNQAILDQRLEAAARASEWLSTRLEQDPDHTLPVPSWTLNASAAFL